MVNNKMARTKNLGSELILLVLSLVMLQTVLIMSPTTTETSALSIGLFGWCPYSGSTPSPMVSSRTYYVTTYVWKFHSYVTTTDIDPIDLGFIRAMIVLPTVEPPYEFNNLGAVRAVLTSTGSVTYSRTLSIAAGVQVDGETGLEVDAGPLGSAESSVTTSVGIYASTSIGWSATYSSTDSVTVQADEVDNNTGTHPEAAIVTSNPAWIMTFKSKVYQQYKNVWKVTEKPNPCGGVTRTYTLVSSTPLNNFKIGATTALLTKVKENVEYWGSYSRLWSPPRSHSTETNEYINEILQATKGGHHGYGSGTVRWLNGGNQIIKNRLLREIRATNDYYHEIEMVDAISAATKVTVNVGITITDQGKAMGVKARLTVAASTEFSLEGTVSSTDSIRASLYLDRNALPYGPSGYWLMNIYYLGVLGMYAHLEPES